MTKPTKLHCLFWMIVLLAACNLQGRTTVQLQEVASYLPLPPNVHLLDQKSGTENIHPNPRCWSNFVHQVYASDNMNLDQILVWFEKHLSASEWRPDLRTKDALVVISQDQIHLSISNDYRFIVFSHVNTNDMEQKHKALFYVGLIQRLDTTLTVLECT